MKVIVFMVLICFLVSCEETRKISELKLAHGLSASHPVHDGMVEMARQLEELSGGDMTIQIYPNGQLGSERELLELVQIGTLAMTKVSAAVMENFAPEYRVLGLPYIFRDKEHHFRVIDGEIGQELLQKGGEYNLLGLCFYDAGSRSFYTVDVPVSKPSDLEGLKLRVMKSQTAVNMVNNLGGSPTPISYGELYSALQQGVVDGAENNPPSFYSSRHYELCRYYSIDEHTMVPDVLLISLDWWERLNEQQQEWVREAALSSVPFQRKAWAESVEHSLEEVQRAGVELIYPDKAPFIDQVESIYDQYREDTAFYKLIQRIKEYDL